MAVMDWWSKHPTADYILAGGVIGGYRVARVVGLDPVVVQSGPSRVEVYQGHITLSAAVFAFAVVPVAIILAVTPGRRLRYLLRNHPHDLRHATAAAAGAAVGAMVAGVVALALDSGDAANAVVRHVVVATLILEILGAARLLELFLLLILNVSRDSEGEGQDPAVAPLRPVPSPELPEGVSVHVE